MAQVLRAGLAGWMMSLGAVGFALPVSGQGVEVPLEEVPYHPNTVPELTDEGAAFNFRLSDARRPPEWFIAIYSGTTLGTYYYVASGMCDLLRATFDEHRIHCTPLRSSGVGGNIHLMNTGQAQSVLVQSDTNYNAANGIRPMPQARSGLSLHNETGVMVVSAESGIESLADLQGKAVNIGADGSATQELWLALLDANGINVEDLGQVYRGTQDSNVRAICDGSIDAFGTWIGHPSTLIASAVARCDARIVGMWGEGTQTLVNDNGYLFEQVIPAGTYPNQEAEVTSYGITASLLFHQNLPNYVTCHMARVVVEHEAFLRTQHPALSNISGDFAVSEGQFLPLHPGVAQYNETGECPPVPVYSERLPDIVIPDFDALRAQFE